MTASNKKIECVSPFLKWAGGKRWLVDKHIHLFDFTFNRYIEPFLGSGAVFFKLLPKQAILSDANRDFINAYEVIKNSREKLEAKLKVHHKNHGHDYYYKIRSSKPRSEISRAAKFIYLNRTCWNGLYRVNLKGEFNVPIGTKNNVILDSDNFSIVSKHLSTVDLRACDFEESLEDARTGDFVFIDPPYTVKHNNNGFLKYNESIFSWDDQLRLKAAVVSAMKRGAKVMLTNANHDSVVDIYRGIGEKYVMKRSSVIAGSASNRGTYEEVLIKCF